MKRKIELWQYAEQICEQTGKGVLLTTKADGKVNTMTIGWGTLGIQWGKPIYTAFVRQSRFTKQLLDKNGEFTVNVPAGEVDKSILGLCGTRSGRDMDKIGELGLTLEAGNCISVPGIKELPLTLECKVIYRQDQDPAQIQPEDMARFYSQGDFHTAYYGQILDAYIIED